MGGEGGEPRCCQGSPPRAGTKKAGRGGVFEPCRAAACVALGWLVSAQASVALGRERCGWLLAVAQAGVASDVGRGAGDEKYLSREWCTQDARFAGLPSYTTRIGQQQRLLSEDKCRISHPELLPRHQGP